MPSYLLIVNPVAGRGAGLMRAEELHRLLGADHTVHLVRTTGRGDATRLARTHGGEVDRVIAIGGDGTLNEVLTGLMDLGSSAASRPCLGFLPGGTANVATRAFGFLAEPNRLAQRLPDMVGRPADVGFADVDGVERPFLLWCGVGVDAVVIDALNSARTGHMGVTGLMMNAPRVLSAVARHGAPDLHMTVDGDPLGPVTSVILANVGDIAFGGTVHRGATPFDGLIDVVSIEKAGPLSAAFLGGHMMLRSLTEARGVSHMTARAVSIHAVDTVPVQIDGEPVGTLPVEVRVATGAVRLLTPADA